MKVLITGGTGVTSSGAQAEALARGYELYLLNRGNSNSRVLPGAKVLSADYTDEAATKAAIGDLVFDAVVDFRVMNVAALEKAVRIFSGHTKQYIFISSGTVYQKPLPSYIVTEDAPLGNVHSAYARNKLLENELQLVYKSCARKGTRNYLYIYEQILFIKYIKGKANK